MSGAAFASSSANWEKAPGVGLSPVVGDAVDAVDIFSFRYHVQRYAECE